MESLESLESVESVESVESMESLESINFLRDRKGVQNVKDRCAEEYVAKIDGGLFRNNIKKV